MGQRLSQKVRKRCVHGRLRQGCARVSSKQCVCNYPAREERRNKENQRSQSSVRHRQLNESMPHTKAFDKNLTIYSRIKKSKACLLK